MLFRTLVLSFVIAVLACGAAYADFVRVFTYPEGGSALYLDSYMDAQDARSDFNDDGVADIFAETGSTGVTIYSINNPDFTPVSLWSYAPDISADGVSVEGAVDIFPAEVAPGKEVIFTWYTYSDGSCFQIVGADEDPLFSYLGCNFQDFADFNGDGLAEIVVEIDGVVEIWGYVPDNSSVGEMLPEAIRLDQNFPNPFNPSTNIKFQLSAPGMTTVTVYDIYGRRVWFRDLGQLTSGSHQVIWNGCDEMDNPVASGSYLYQLHSGTWTSQKKMVLIK